MYFLLGKKQNFHLLALATPCLTVLSLFDQYGWVLFTFELMPVPIQDPAIRYQYPMVHVGALISLNKNKKEKFSKFSPVQSFTSRDSVSRVLYLVTVQTTCQSVFSKAYFSSILLYP